MVLSASDLGIRDGLNPVFCSICGNRIGWANDDSDLDNILLECDDCAKKPKEEDDN